MVNGGIKITGLKDVQRKLERVAKACPKEASRAINDSLMVAHKRVSYNLTNRILNVDTGTLRDRFQIKASTAQKLIGILGAKLDYAAIHEFGGSAGRGRSVKLRARYYFSKSINQSMKKINRFFDKAINRIVKA